MRIRLLFVVWCVASSALAQSAPLPISVDLEPGAPVAISGSAEIVQTASKKAVLHVETENVTEKAILLSVLRFEITNSDLQSDPRLLFHSDDFFFSSNPFGVHVKQKIDVPDYNAQDENISKVTASVWFVQFADGSIWGDAKEGSTYLCIRTHSLKILSSLEESYRSGGMEAFGNLLMKQQDMVTGEAKNLYISGKPQTALQTIEDRLRNAELHSKALALASGRVPQP